MTDDSGTFTGVLKICADVTERKKNQQRLRQAQKLESLGILAGGVAHDFNNLLTAIIGNASLVLERTESATPSRKMLQSLITAGERAAQLTRQLLTYAGKDQGRLQPLELAAIVRELVPLLTAIIPKMVNLSMELEDGGHWVSADPAQLQQVMMNLVINAAESIPPNGPGEVKVTVGRRRLQSEDYRDAVVPIEMNDREYVSFRVTDNGTGMDPATQSRIFDPFFTTKFQGRGLGLAAVLGIVKGLGGTLTVRSAPEQGSVFTVLLPAIQAAAEARGEPPRPRSPDRQRRASAPFCSWTTTRRCAPSPNKLWRSTGTACCWRATGVKRSPWRRPIRRCARSCWIWRCPSWAAIARGRFCAPCVPRCR